MAEPDKKASHNGRTSRLKSRPDGRPGEALDREGSDYSRRVYAEAFRGMGDVSGLEPDATMKH
jgi:hypothetical protein